MYPDMNDSMVYVRRSMIDKLVSRGVIPDRVLGIAAEIPRHLFVSEALRYSAYDDTSLPIGFGQTISMPSTIIKMVQALNLAGHEKVLEIGTGSGYQTAILARLCTSVVSMERIRELVIRASALLIRMNYTNVKFLHEEDFNNVEGAFDAIVVAAGADILPVELMDKLNPGGRLVIPVGMNGRHVIKKFTRAPETIIEEIIGAADFVPFIMTDTA